MTRAIKFIMGESSTLCIENRKETIFTLPPQSCEHFQSSKAQIYIDVNELDVAQIKIPPMGYIDRKRFSRQKQLIQKPNLLLGFEIHQQNLTEVTCPITTMMKAWFDFFQENRICVQSIQPLFIAPLAKEDVIVLSTHQDEMFRHTAYKQGKPIFTRLTNSANVGDDLLATLTYLSNQYNFLTKHVECHGAIRYFESLKNLSHGNLTIDFFESQLDKNGKLQNTIPFSIPSPLHTIRENRKYKIPTTVASISTGLLLICGLGQGYDYSRLLHQKHKQQTDLNQIQQEVQQIRMQIPAEQWLPKNYQTELKEPSPMDLFQKIAISLSGDLVVSALKWENSPTEERILLEVNRIHPEEDPEENMGTFHEFYATLQDNLDNYEVQAQSLPYASAGKQTFSGSASGQKLNIEGDITKARFLLTRKKIL